MPSTVSSPVVTEFNNPHTNTDAKRGFRTVLGLSPFTTPSLANTSQRRSALTANTSTIKERRSVDVSSSGTYFVPLSYRKKKARVDRASVTDASLYLQDSSPTAIADASSASRPQPTHAPTSIPSVAQVHFELASRTMTKTMEVPQERASRRKLVRMEAQDGPWSVSVAETPYDKKSYSIYIKTPTHHLTLTRTAGEIAELHRKLTSAHPDLGLPDLPIQMQEGIAEPVSTEKKRKSSFLHTLSRLASPGPNKRDRERGRDWRLPSGSANSRSSVASNTTSSPSTAATLSTPTSSPSKEPEIWDPITSPLAAPSDASSAMCTALAGYLTTLANEQSLKNSKSWRRFVRVRTDDLISERVERAVKRVRSDLAAHLSGGLHRPKSDKRREEATHAPSLNSTVVIGEDQDLGEMIRQKLEEPSGIIEEQIKEEDEEEDRAVAAKEAQQTEQPPVLPGPGPIEEGAQPVQEAPGTPKPADTALPPAPEAEQPVQETTEKPVLSEIPSASGEEESNHVAIASRIPRSQSADPDKASRLSRLYNQTPLKGDAEDSAMESESEAQVETEVEGETTGTQTMDDDSSSSIVIRKRKKTRSEPTGGSKPKQAKKTSRKVVIDDFDMMRVLGKGCAGKVLLVKHKKSSSLYALKAITKRHVLAHQELQHTLTEQAVLKRMAREAKDPFVVKLWWSFHDRENLFLVMDFHPGGDLATQLARWGRLGRDRARFYAAEIVEGVDGLHAAGVIYRDLKPENILIGSDGHIVLTDFGLSKEFPRRSTAITAPPTPSGSRSDFHAPSQQGLPYWMQSDDSWAPSIGQNESTSTFCGTAEYLAPEVIQGLPYSFEVDWWSFGTMLYEMLTGITPFWANNHSEMYVRVLQDELKFPDDRVMDQDTKSLIRGLLQRNPALRMKQPRIKRHPYFSMIDWSHVYYKRYIPPYIPPIDPSNASDTQNFDDAFLDMEPVIDNEPDQTDSDRAGERTDTDRTDGEDSVRTPAQSRSPSAHPEDDGPDLFDGYSFKGRHSVLIDEEEEEAEVDEEEKADADMEEVDDSATQASAEVSSNAVEDEASTPELEASEPNTPEPRQTALPEEGVIEPAIITEPAVANVEDVELESVESIVPEVPPKIVEIAPSPEVPPAGDKSEADLPPLPQTPEYKTVEISPIVTEIPQLPAPNKLAPPPRVPPRNRREKSGVHALDKYLSDAGDDAGDDGEITEREEDDDWDFIEAPGAGFEDRNGTKGTSLFARGVVDRYRLAVFRKASTPNKNSTPRNVSGMSASSDVNSAGVTESPSPTEKQRRGRNPPLSFRRNPRTFLRARSPPSSYSTRSNGTSKTLAHSSSASSANMITPSASTNSSTIGPSLKSKESTTSVGSPSSDDQSVNGDSFGAPVDAATGPNALEASKQPSRSSLADEPEKTKTKKLKKYKEGAEKMLSLFASPR